MRISISQTKRGKIVSILIVTSLVVAVVSSALLITVFLASKSDRDSQKKVDRIIHQDHISVLSRDNTEPGSTQAPFQSFRFFEKKQHLSEHDREWRILGSNKLGEDNHEMIQGFLPHRILHFTFDDGPFAGATPQLLDMLSEYNVGATFFVVGKNLFGSDSLVNRDLIKRIEKDGHTVAVHSYTHNDFRHLSDAQMTRELYRSERVLKANIGYRPGLFRPPYGGRSKRTNSLIRARGYTEILWNIAPEEFGARTPKEILSNFQAELDRLEQHDRGPGGIVLLHDNRASTVQAFPLIMEELRRRNCSLIHQDGQELWDVVGNLSYFLIYNNKLPESLITQRQTLARSAAIRYCARRG